MTVFDEFTAAFSYQTVREASHAEHASTHALTRFKHVYHGTQKLDGRTAHVLTLTPRTDIGYKTLKVGVDGSDYLVRRFQITELSGGLVEFQLSNVNVNPVLGDEIFRFTPPAGTKVIDR